VFQFDVDQIRELVPKRVLEKYKVFKRNAEIEANPNNRWCPTPDCDTILTATDENPKLTCPT
jgi:hypothetical protein